MRKFGFSVNTASIISAFIVVIFAANIAITRAHRDAYAIALRADSLEVSLDSTRRIVGVLGADRNLWQRRAFQTDMRADSLDKALKQESKARSDLSLVVKELVATASSSNPVIEVAGVRSADFHIRQTPYTADLHITLPAPPADGLVVAKIAIDTARVGVRVSCGTQRDGVKSASVTVSTPVWLNVNVDSSATDVGVCNPKLKKAGRLSQLLDKAEKIGLFVGGVWLGFKL